MRRSSGVVAPWRVEIAGLPLELAVNGPLVVNDFPTMLGAALGGIGLAQVPEPLAAKDVSEGRLEEVLLACASKSPGVFLYHSGRRQVLPKLRAFIDHVRGQAAGLGTSANEAVRTATPRQPGGRQ